MISIEVVTSEISTGQDNQTIINKSFYKEPSKIYVNGILREDCKYFCQLSDERSNITIIFDEDITSCENMFYGLNNLIEIDLSNFDNSKVTAMNSMFRECKNLENINFGEINTSSVKDMSFLFEHCEKLTSIDLSNFDTSSVTKMNFMFSSCIELKSIDASSFNTTKVEEMQDLFSHNDKLITVDVSSFDTSNTKNMRALFYCSDHLEYLNLGKFDTSSMTTITYIFGYCKNLKYLNIKNFNISRNIDTSIFEQTFEEIPQSTKYCILDEYTKNKFIPNENSDCSDTCFQENIKFDMGQEVCILTCHEFDYQIGNDCYNSNPDDIKNFYLDNDNIYKLCYSSCQTCISSGNRINHNCDTCKENFIFLNDSKVNPRNCYKKCDYYYYFDENNHYFCSFMDKCPKKQNKLIEPKKNCIDDCKNDDEYFYEYNNTCLKKCPENTKIYEDIKLCLDECYQTQFEYNNTCYDDCPNGTFRLYQNRNICVEIVPENYYLDNNDNIRKECYHICKKCNQTGNEINNNCQECIDNYKFLNDPNAIQGNCYKNCTYNYYFNESKQYTCTESDSCPNEFKKLIGPKKKCIDDCKNDDKYLFDYKNDCLENCLENTKIYLENKLCLDECYQNQFEYNNYCYNECPDRTHKLFNIRNICVDIIPENYYLDNNDNIHKECFYTCKKCNQSGNEINNNCLECNDNYKFLNDSLAILNNCYNICDLYYFDENNQYFCTQSCPSSYPKLIKSKKKCIDVCKKDDEYLLDYNNQCYRECPENTKLYHEEYKCFDSCNSTQIEYKGICYNNLQNEDYNSDFNDLLNNVLLSSYTFEEGESIMIERPDNTVYQITTSKNELELLKNKSSNVNNISIIDLGECETILKQHYHINENDSLIFVKSECKANKASEKKVNYEVYEPYNKTKLNLSFCEDTPINLYIPMELSRGNKQIYQQLKDSGHDMFDINDPFYQDICTPFDSSSGTDILLSDRVDYIYNNDDTQCQPNCQFSQYSMDSQYLTCSCSAVQDTNNNNDNVKKDKFSAKKIYESFYDVLKYSNYDIIKCANILGNANIITINIGSIMTISYFLCYFICLIIFIFSGITPLKKRLRDNLNKTSENMFSAKSNVKYIFNPPIRKAPQKKLILRAELEKGYQMKLKMKKDKSKSNSNEQNKIKDIKIYSYSNSNSALDNSPNDKFNELKMKTSLQNFKIETESNKKKEKEYSDYELNELEYEEAIELDKRTLIQIYWASLKREHLIFFTFFNCTDYNLLTIKLSRFVFLIVGDMALNVFFFSDDSMHKLFINYGKYDFFQQIPQITYSTIISQLIEIFLCFLSLTDKHIYQIKYCLENKKFEKISKIIKCMNIKLIFFYVFTFVVFGMYWYIISVFCGVFRNTQKAFIKDSAVSFSICLAYPFVFYLISAIFRIYSLRSSKKNRKYLYKLSYMIPLF